MSASPDEHAAPYRQQVEAAAAAIREQTHAAPAIGLILGTGLGGLADEIEVGDAFPYDKVPGFPEATVEMHEGRLLFGRLNDVPIVAMQGRFHLYEGYTPKEVAFPVRVMATLGMDTLLISNAAGGMDPHHALGDLMLVTDHLNLQAGNPLTGPNEDDWGPRFLDMSEPYDPALRALAKQEALDAGIPLHEGVYLAVTGPMLETKAEYRFMRQIGGDVVGMSTVPEVLAARHMDVRCLCLSVITDECLPDALEPIDVEKIMAAAGKAAPKVARVIRGVIREVGDPTP